MKDKESLPTPPSDMPEGHLVPQRVEVEAHSETGKAMRALEEKRKKQQKRRRLQIIAIVALILLLIGFGACSVINKQIQNQVAGQAPTDVVTLGTFDKEIKSNGALQPARNQNITPKTVGTISEVLVAEGDTVKEDQILFTIDNPQLDQAIKAAELGVKQAELGLTQAKQQVTDARNAEEQARKAEAEAKRAQAEAERMAAAQAAAQATAAEEAARQAAAQQEAAQAAAEEAMREEARRMMEEALKEEQEQMPPLPETPEVPSTTPEPAAFRMPHSTLRHASDPGPDISSLTTGSTRGGHPGGAPSGMGGGMPSGMSGMSGMGDLGSMGALGGMGGGGFDASSAKTAIQAAELGVENAELALESAKEQLAAAEEAADARTVRSPIDGEVISINVEPGMSIESFMSTGKSAVQISDITNMRVEMKVNEIDILQVERDLEARVTFDAVPDLTQTGKVSAIAASPDGGESAVAMGGGGMFGGGGGGSGIVTYPVDITLDDPDERLKIGMTADVTLNIEHLENVLMVPLTAVFNDGTKSYVNRVTYDSSGVAISEQVEVTLVTSNETVSVITGPIEEGDTVEISSSPTDFMGLFG